MEDIDFEETDHFQPGAIPWRLSDPVILPKTYLYEFGGGPENFSKIFDSTKSYLLDRQTRRQTGRSTFLTKKNV